MHHAMLWVTWRSARVQWVVWQKVNERDGRRATAGTHRNGLQDFRLNLRRVQFVGETDGRQTALRRTPCLR